MNATRVMMASAVVLAISMGMISCSSCMSEWKTKTILSDGPQVTDVRQLEGFEEIEINGNPRICYTQADSFSVIVKGTREAVDNILTEVDGKTLGIRNRGKINLVNVSFDDSNSLTVYVTSPDLTGIRLNGSGDFISRQRIDTDNMDVTLRGSGDIQVDDLICDRCHVELIGSGDIDLASVEAQETSAVLIGSGDIDLCLQKVDDTRLALKGSGDITVEFNKDCGAVDCDLRGSGDITLEGKVKKFSQYKSGSGDINVDKLYILK